MQRKYKNQFPQKGFTYVEVIEHENGTIHSKYSDREKSFRTVAERVPPRTRLRLFSLKNHLTQIENNKNLGLRGSKVITTAGI